MTVSVFHLLKFNLEGGNDHSLERKVWANSVDHSGTGKEGIW